MKNKSKIKKMNDKNNEMSRTFPKVVKKMNHQEEA